MVLDEYKWEMRFRNPDRCVRKDHGAAVLWHGYLVFQCRHWPKRDDQKLMPHLGDMRRVVDAIVQYQQGLPGAEEYRDVQEADSEWDDVLDRLCWLAVDCCKSGEIWTGWYRYRKPKLGLSILSAATYFKYTSLARDLLGQGHDPTTDDGLFPCPMFIAARTGQADMLRLFQEHLPQFQQDNIQAGDLTTNWPSKIGPGSLPGAAARGDMEMVRLCLFPEGQTLIHGYEPGSIPSNTHLSSYITTSMMASRSAEIYQYLESLISPLRSSPPYYLPYIRTKAMAQAGDLAMVKFHLDTGGLETSQLSVPLAEAARACNYDVVDLILERGADPNGEDARGRTILMAAAKSGSMTMVRKLLDAGAKCGPTILLQAVKHEHTAMVEMLLDMGRGWDERERVLSRAKALGLESMADLLRSRRGTTQTCKSALTI